MKTFIVQASLTIVTYDRKNMFIVQANDWKNVSRNQCGSLLGLFISKDEKKDLKDFLKQPIFKKLYSLFCENKLEGLPLASRNSKV
jgi:hypothetical protein